MKRFPFESTSSVPHAGEFGTLVGFIQVSPPLIERLNCLAAVIISVGAPELILESSPSAVGVIDGRPLFIAAIRRRDISSMIDRD